jgi:hypothetical protein
MTGCRLCGFFWCRARLVIVLDHAVPVTGQVAGLVLLMIKITYAAFITVETAKIVNVGSGLLKRLAVYKPYYKIKTIGMQNP